MENTAIEKLDPKEFGLEKSKATEITKGLSNILKEKEILSEQYAKVIKLETTKENCSVFRELRLQLRDNRTKGIEVWHKGNKEYFLRGGQFVDAIRRKESDENIRMEEQLLKGEKHFEILEEERKEKLKVQRENALVQFETETEHLQLGEMSDEVWQKYFNGVKLEYEQRIEAEKKAEKERIAKEKALSLHEGRKAKLLNYWQYLPVASDMFFGDMSEDAFNTIFNDAKKAKEANDKKQEAIRKDNERLQKEAEATEAKAKKAKEASNKIAEELQAKKDAETKAEADRKEAEAKEQRLPDKKKLIELAERFATPKLPEVKSEEAKNILKEVAELCNKISIFITEKSTNL